MKEETVFQLRKLQLNLKNINWLQHSKYCDRKNQENLNAQENLPRTEVWNKQNQIHIQLLQLWQLHYYWALAQQF